MRKVFSGCYQDPWHIKGTAHSWMRNLGKCDEETSWASETETQQEPEATPQILDCIFAQGVKQHAALGNIDPRSRRVSVKSLPVGVTTPHPLLNGNVHVGYNGTNVASMSTSIFGKKMIQLKGALITLYPTPASRGKEAKVYRIRYREAHAQKEVH